MERLYKQLADVWARRADMLGNVADSAPNKTNIKLADAAWSHWYRLGQRAFTLEFQRRTR